MVRIITWPLIVFVFLSNTEIALAHGKKKMGATIDSLNSHYLNWYNLDSRANNIKGGSVDKAYRELLAGKLPKKTIVVAVIDGGVDISHVDLQGKIWVNTREIPNNQVDDDHNGYVDDINGWNFLGNASGENLDTENYEFVRIVERYKNLYDTVSHPETLSEKELADYKLFRKCQKRYDKELHEINSQLEELNGFKVKLDSAIEALEPYTKCKNPNLHQVNQVVPANPREANAKKLLKYILKQGFTYSMLDDEMTALNKEIKSFLNPRLNARQIVGDDSFNSQQVAYGNNDVKGPNSEHGSFVAGIIAANRNNNTGINGIADAVKIMVLRAVPDGDEYDKDVALAIRYAVDNGANIINMSFGKEFSPLKEMVDEALVYAESRGVLLVHAAGNEAANCDTVESYPTKRLNNNSVVKNWINVGANAKTANKSLPGFFSNYGKQTVDIFAPGVDIISLAAGNTYNLESGTSFSSPVASGVAALVWSFYPELTASVLKEILLESSVRYTKKVYQPNISSSKKTKVKFSSLSVTGGIVNAYQALKLAESKTQ